MTTHHFTTQKTARYFTLGNIETAAEIWIVLHGYAQLAIDFIQNFEDLLSPQTAIVAPEGMHRFYKKGFYGDVAASWMTREDRLSDISDNAMFLSNLYQTLIKPNQTVQIFGFSQGVATACRWLAMADITPKNIVLWSGTFPDDLELKKGNSVFSKSNVYLAYDENDPFRTDKSWQKQLDFFEENGITPIHFRFEGGHSIPKDVLKKFVETYINPSLSS
ncbi:MAG: phospholipase [Flavobacteriales bacterium]|nr:phospholipase [Flavobacteriales bacterium]